MTAIHIPKLRDLHGLLLTLAAVALFAMTVLAFILTAWPPVAAVRECDRQVAILLSTHDALELQRSMFLIQQLNCGIGKRL